MKTRRLWIIASICVLFGRPVAGQVQAITVQPEKPIVNFPATITVTGMNPCGAIQVDYGSLDDGLPPTVITHAITSLPTSVKQTWKSVGPRQIVVTGMGNCTGKAFHTITVVYPGRSPQPPTITAVIGTSTPGGVAAITGSGFGTTPGTVRAHLNTWNNLKKVVVLEAGPWKSGLIEVHWPTDLTGVRDQDATIDVTTSGKQTSNARKIHFVPELVTEVLPYQDVALIVCGKDSNVDNCIDFVDPDDNGWTSMGCSTDSSFCGSHENAWAAIGDDSGDDIYAIKVVNDWSLDHMEFTYKDQSGGSLSGPSGFPHAGTSWSAKIHWSVTPNDDVGYAVAVWIIGPKGVPHK